MQVGRDIAWTVAFGSWGLPQRPTTSWCSPSKRGNRFASAGHLRRSQAGTPFLSHRITVLYYTVLHCTALHCTVPYCSVLFAQVRACKELEDKATAALYSTFRPTAAPPIPAFAVVRGHKEFNEQFKIGHYNYWTTGTTLTYGPEDPALPKIPRAIKDLYRWHKGHHGSLAYEGGSKRAPAIEQVYSVDVSVDNVRG